MEEIKIPARLKNYLAKFIKQVKEAYQEGLVSVNLYGSAASGEFIDQHSNLNVLVVLRDTSLDNLKKIAKIMNKFKLIHPLFLTEEYIAASSDIFPIEFLDMQENYSLLYGKDVLKEINIDTRNLRFQCEQELRVKLLNLKQAYLRADNQKFALRHLIYNSFTSLLHILRNVLRVKGIKPPYQKQEIIKELALSFQIKQEIWEKILSAKTKQRKISSEEIEDLFNNFIRDLERMEVIVDKM